MANLLNVHVTATDLNGTANNEETMMTLELTTLDGSYWLQEQKLVDADAAMRGTPDANNEWEDVAYFEELVSDVAALKVKREIKRWADTKKRIGAAPVEWLRRGIVFHKTDHQEMRSWLKGDYATRTELSNMFVEFMNEELPAMFPSKDDVDILGNDLKATEEEIAVADNGPDFTTYPGKVIVTKMLRLPLTGKSRPITTVFEMGKKGRPAIRWEGSMELNNSGAIVKNERRKIANIKVGHAPVWYWDEIESYWEDAPMSKAKDVYIAKGVNATRGGEYTVGKECFSDMESDGDDRTTVAMMLTLGVIGTEEAKELELNDVIRSYGDDWLSDEITTRHPLYPVLAASWHANELSTKWTVKKGRETIVNVSVAQAAKIRDTMIAHGQMVMVFRQDTLSFVKEKLVEVGVDGLCDYIKMLDQPDYVEDDLYGHHHLYMQDEGTRSRKDEFERLTSESDRHFVEMESMRDKRFDHLADREVYESRIANLYNEWQTKQLSKTRERLNDDRFDEVFETPTWHLWMDEKVVIDKATHNAHQMVERVRSCETPAELAKLSSFLMHKDRKIDGYQAMNIMWEAYHNHAKAMEVEVNPLAAMLFDALPVGCNGVRKTIVKTHSGGRQTLMLLESNQKLKRSPLRKVVTGMRRLVFDDVVVMPAGTAGSHVFPTYGELVGYLSELSLEGCTAEVVKTLGMTSDTKISNKIFAIHHGQRTDCKSGHLFLVAFENTKGSWVLYETPTRKEYRVEASMLYASPLVERTTTDEEHALAASQMEEAEDRQGVEFTEWDYDNYDYYESLTKDDLTALDDYYGSDEG